MVPGGHPFQYRLAVENPVTPEPRVTASAGLPLMVTSPSLRSQAMTVSHAPWQRIPTAASGLSRPIATHWVESIATVISPNMQSPRRTQNSRSRSAMVASGRAACQETDRSNNSDATTLCLPVPTDNRAFNTAELTVRNGSSGRSSRCGCR